MDNVFAVHFIYRPIYIAHTPIYAYAYIYRVSSCIPIRTSKRNIHIAKIIDRSDDGLLCAMLVLSTPCCPHNLHYAAGNRRCQGLLMNGPSYGNGPWPWHSRALAWMSSIGVDHRPSPTRAQEHQLERSSNNRIQTGFLPLESSLSTVHLPPKSLSSYCCCSNSPLFSTVSYRLLTACSWTWNRIEFSCTCYF